jgi:hypothetical protein
MPLIHVVNFVIFCGVLLCFAFFMKSWLAARGDEARSNEDESHVVSFCFCVFIWFVTDFITVRAVTPDLCVAGIVFLAAGFCCRILLPDRASWAPFLALGAVLGLGYYVKAALFPLGMALVVGLFIWPAPCARGRLKAVLSAVTLLIVSAPLVILISEKVGHLSIGETGRLNYGWFAGGLPMRWEGGVDNASGVFEHPPRTLLTNPAVLEFAEPVPGSYPLGYDAAYWYAGANFEVSLAGLVRAIRGNAPFYVWAFERTLPCLAAASLLLAQALRRKTPLRLGREVLWLTGWSIAAFAMYAMLHAEARLLGAFFALFCLAICRPLWVREVPAAKGVLLAAALCMLVMTCARVSRDVLRPDRPDYLRIAKALRAAGLKQGDRLAIVGRASDIHYARTIGAQVIAQVIDADEFRCLDAPGVTRVTDHLAAIGVNAVVAPERPQAASSREWQDVRLSDSLLCSFALVHPRSLPSAE